MTTLLKKFWKDEEGLELSEYAVMMALIIFLIIAAVVTLSTAIKGRFQQTADIITTS